MSEPEIVQHIEITPGIRGGRARLRGTRITVDDIVVMHLRLGLSLPEIAGKYDLSPAAIYAAMAYYYDHRDQIERSIAEDRAYAEAFQRDNPSLLRDKLRSLRIAA
jgi:uncharacterized protein (DUF433 family)